MNRISAGEGLRAGRENFTYLRGDAMKKPLLVAVLCTFGLAFAVQAADNGAAVRVPGAHDQLKSATVSEDKDQASDKIHWKNGTIIRWDAASKTFVLRDTTGKNRGHETTFTWNDKTMLEGMETKVGQRAKVKYSEQGSVNIARHVFVGRRAINAHKEDKAAENAIPPG